MPNADAQSERGWLGPALGIVLAVTAARVVLLAFNRTDLFVDEAQYWLWGQDFAFGYYSKPPLIAWVIRVATDLAGSDAPFWVRLPAPLFHAVTAILLAAVAARLLSARAAVVVATAYITLPMVAVGSLLISTDTIMFPFLAIALIAYIALLRDSAPRVGLAALVGLALGVAFLAKYAAIYFLVFGAAAAIHPALRPRPIEAAVIVAAFLAAIAPNIAWNATNGLATVSHTVDNTGWRNGIEMAPSALGRFLAEQLLVIGPVTFFAWVLSLWRRAGPSGALLLVWLSLPIVMAVSAQALISGANANWAAAAYLPGTILAVGWLLARRRLWLVLSFVINGALSLALPLATVAGPALEIDGQPLLKRYLGLSDLSREIVSEARALGAVAIAADERAVLADLFYTGRDSGLPIFAWPKDRPPANHYEQSHRLEGQVTGPVLAVSRGDTSPPCKTAADGEIIPGPGAYQGSTFRFWLVPAGCWAP